MRQKQWNIKTPHDEGIAALVEALGVHRETAAVLHGRGYTLPTTAKAFLHKETGQFYDPFLLGDMLKAATRVKKAIDEDEKITIYGDYDVDGVTATSVLFLYLKSLGANVETFIPGRFTEGYGLNAEAIHRIAENKTTLLITVDTGITAIEEAELCKALGISLVITDHHTCREVLPDAEAVVDPKRPDDTYPFKDLAGVGVAFKLVCAVACLAHRDDPARCREILKPIYMRFAEYAAIGTVADVMPLRDENRLIVYLGLALMENTQHIGLRALIDAIHKGEGERTGAAHEKKPRRITAGFLSFALAPRINAVGRLSAADRAVQLFCTDSPSLAATIAEELCEANRERQTLENKIAEEAFHQVETEHNPDNECILVLSGEHWHHGVIGIVASRVTEKYHLPCMLISFDGNREEPTGDDVGRGSGRSIAGFSLIDAISKSGDMLLKYGGHAGAAGLSVRRDMLPMFRAALEKEAETMFGGVIPPASLDIDCVMYPEEATIELCDELSMLEPYGVGNPTPVFASEGLIISQIVPLSGGKHTKFVLSDEDDRSVAFEALWFGVHTESIPFHIGDKVDVAYQLGINEFRGARTVQLLVQDMRFYDAKCSFYFRHMSYFGDVLRGKAVTTETVMHPCEMLPSRDLCAEVYTYLRTMTDNGKTPYCTDLMPLCYNLHLDICRVLLILEIFVDASLISYTTLIQSNNVIPVYRIELCTQATVDENGNRTRKNLYETETAKHLAALYAQ